MTFWNTLNPKKPTGIKDPDAVLDYPIDFSAWLTDMQDLYVSHTVSVTGGLVCEDSSHSLGVITPVLSGGTEGELASFTIHIVTASGREDDRTFYLKIQER